MTRMPDQTRPDDSLDRLARDVRAGDRRALARAITLVESTRADHRVRAEALLSSLLPFTGSAVRIGISGPPGVGKSTFIEAFGRHLITLGHRVAVLAVDPTSRRSGGSILGDKTRMDGLAQRPEAFIRPSPAGSTLGGLARRSREVLLLCESAGYDMVLVETVGVGQSELAVADMTDLFLLLVSPGGGDELQGIKRGIMELADLVVVTKSDGDLATAARHAAADHKRALHLLRPPHPELHPTAMLVSSTVGDGIAEVADRVLADHATLVESGGLALLRARQRKAWLWSEVTELVTERFRSDPQVAARLDDVETGVADGRIAPVAAARGLLEELDRSSTAPRPGSRS